MKMNETEKQRLKYVWSLRYLFLGGSFFNFFLAGRGWGVEGKREREKQ